MLEPGANRSKHVPTFENPERWSVIVVEPTVRALASRAGDWKHAFPLLLPAETLKVMPADTAFATAASRGRAEPAAEAHVRDRRGNVALFRIQSTPAITPDVNPDPLQLSTRTGTMDIAFAMP